MGNNNAIEIQDQTSEFTIPDEVRRIDELLNNINQQLVGDQGLVCEGAIMYLATALVHSAGDVEKNIQKAKEMLDKYVGALKLEHAGCIEQLVADGQQGEHLAH